MYLVWSAIDFFEDVQDFTLADYRLSWKQKLSWLCCQKQRAEPLVAATGPQTAYTDDAKKDAETAETRVPMGPAQELE